jgi:hypothetical protein
MCNEKQRLAYQLHHVSVMRKLLQTLAISGLLLAPASAANAQISFGITIGAPPAPRAYRVPRQPGPDYEWIEGYWYPQGSRYVWHDGYWTRPPYEGAYWVVPYHVGGQYFAGRWEGSRGIVAQNHRGDRGRQRDERREPRSGDRNDGRR